MLEEVDQLDAVLKSVPLTAPGRLDPVPPQYKGVTVPQATLVAVVASPVSGVLVRYMGLVPQVLVL